MPLGCGNPWIVRVMDLRFSKHYLCNCDNFSVKVVCHGRKSSVEEGRALRMRLAMPMSSLRTETLGSQVDEIQTARTCELCLFLPMNVCSGSLCQNVTPML